MNLNVKAKKGSGLGDIFKDYVPQQLEEHSVVKVEHSALVSDVFNLYLTYLQDESCYSHGAVKFGVEDEIYERVKAVDAMQCTTLLEQMKGCAGFEYHSTLFDSFIDTLIQKSYDAGYNDFLIDSSQIPNEGFGVILTDLEGTAQRPLHVTIRTRNPHVAMGNTAEMGNGFEHRAVGIEYCIFEIHGNLWGNHEDLPYADGAKHSTYIHYGLLRVRQPDGMSDFTTPKDCIFKTTNAKTLRILQNLPVSVNGNQTNNRIYFIDADGKEHLR